MMCNTGTRTATALERCGEFGCSTSPTSTQTCTPPSAIVMMPSTVTICAWLRPVRNTTVAATSDLRTLGNAYSPQRVRESLCAHAVSGLTGCYSHHNHLSTQSSSKRTHAQRGWCQHRLHALEQELATTRDARPSFQSHAPPNSTLPGRNLSTGSRASACCARSVSGP